MGRRCGPSVEWACAKPVLGIRAHWTQTTESIAEKPKDIFKQAIWAIQYSDIPGQSALATGIFRILRRAGIVLQERSVDVQGTAARQRPSAAASTKSGGTDTSGGLSTGQGRPASD
jgi:hypothetical protein